MKINKILTLFLILAIYLIAITLTAFFISQEEDALQPEEEKSTRSSLGAQLGATTNVHVSVEKKRWYGKIIEHVGEKSKISNLYLFRILKIPLYVKNFSFVPMHLSFLIVLSLIYLFVFLVETSNKQRERRRHYNELDIEGRYYPVNHPNSLYYTGDRI